MKLLYIDIDVAHFSSQMNPSSDNGFVRSDLFFHPGWREKKVWICFEHLFALTSTPEEHPHGLTAKEAEIKRKEQGMISIILNMPGFFNRWHKNYTKLWQDLFVPSTEPLEEVILEVNIKVPVTAVMLQGD